LRGVRGEASAPGEPALRGVPTVLIGEANTTGETGDAHAAAVGETGGGVIGAEERCGVWTGDASSISGTVTV